MYGEFPQLAKSVNSSGRKARRHQHDLVRALGCAEASNQQAITSKIGRTDARRESPYLAFGADILSPCETAKLLMSCRQESLTRPAEAAVSVCVLRHHFDTSSASVGLTLGADVDVMPHHFTTIRTNSTFCALRELTTKTSSLRRATSCSL